MILRIFGPLFSRGDYSLFGIVAYCEDSSYSIPKLDLFQDGLVEHMSRGNFRTIKTYRECVQILKRKFPHALKVKEPTGCFSYAKGVFKV